MLWLAYLLIFLYGLAHTPLVVDLLRHFFPHWNIQRLTSNTSSIILALLILLVFLLSLGMQMFIFIPLMPAVPLWPLKVTIHSLFAYWIWINAVVNYLYVLFSKPGIFRPSYEDNDGSDSRHVKEVKVSESSLPASRIPDSELEYVRKKPLHSHHCKICQATIPYRDHHCPFTGNCIGLDNYSYFFLALFYSMLGLAYGVAVFFVYFGECFFLAWKAIGALDTVEDQFCKTLEPYGEIMLPSIGGLVTVILMFTFQVLMLMANISTYDVLKQWRKIRIDLRSFRKEGSRFRVMFLDQRTHPVWFLLPVRNKHNNIIVM